MKICDEEFESTKHLEATVLAAILFCALTSHVVTPLQLLFTTIYRRRRKENILLVAVLQVKISFLC